jgi:hypothetical protein
MCPLIRRSFPLQALGRVGPGRLGRLDADGREGQGRRRRTRQDEQADPDRGPVVEVSDPRPHRHMRDGPGDEVGQEDPSQEMPGEQGGDRSRRRAQHLADADLLGLLLGGEGGQPERL